MNRSYLVTASLQPELACDVRPKYDTADNRSSDCSDKHGSSGDIFRIAHDRRKIWRRGIGQKLKSGVECFRRPHNCYCEHNPAPFVARELKENSQNNCRHCRRRMNPSVVLASNHSQQTNDRVFEASKAPREFKWAGLGGVFVSFFHFFSIASRFGLNSLPGFHSGNLSVLATS